MISRLLAFLLLKALLITLFILYGNVGLGPDEAQYWTWSQQPALGYYSKPPGIAWQIGLTTHLFGNTELGVRFGALLIGTLIPLAVYFLARRCSISPLGSFWAGMAMAFCPLGVMASFLAITDGGQVLFWTLSLLVVAAAYERLKPPSYFLLGLCILGGALFKWPMFLLWLFALGTLSRSTRLNFMGGVVLSLLALLPSLLWNSQHGWVTFRHVGATIENGEVTKETANFFSFLGAQVALLSPIFFALLLVGIWILVRRLATLTPALTFCGWTSVTILFGYSLLALVKKMQGNWCDFAYPGAIVLMAWTAYDYLERGKKWMVAGTALAAALSLFAFAIPTLQERSLVPLPYSISPFRHNVGWKKLGEELKNAGYDPSHDFLFSDKYQMSSILSFYGEGQKRAYFLNLHRIRKNQFTFWPSMKQEQLGRTGYFVVTENVPALNRLRDRISGHYTEKLNEYFDQVEYLGQKPLFFSNGLLVKAAFIFRCVGYNGREPVDPALY